MHMIINLLCENIRFTTTVVFTINNKYVFLLLHQVDANSVNFSSLNLIVLIQNLLPVTYNYLQLLRVTSSYV